MIEMKYLVSTLVYTVMGSTVLIGGFFVFDKLTPYDLWKEICEKSNVALAILLGSLGLGLSIIIASAMH